MPFQLTLEPRQIEFGRVFVGTTREQTAQLIIRGAAGNYISHFEGDAEGMVFGPAVGNLTNAVGQDLVLSFRPASARLQRARVGIQIRAADTSTTVFLHLTATGVMPPDCEDGNGCTIDEFNPMTERCEHRAEARACNDLNACTRNDFCYEGLCLGESTSCDDQDICTDDFCDPAVGCRNIPTARCDDGNPCTNDVCLPDGGCEHTDRDNGTPCDDAEQCTSADVCLFGQCIGVSIPEGSTCDDQDYCSKNERCIAGKCEDPDYQRPGIGQEKYLAQVGPLAPTATENPLIDFDNTVYVGTASGAVAIDECGETIWRNDSLGTPRWGAATKPPGRLVVPVENILYTLQPRTGELASTIDVHQFFADRLIITSTQANDTMRTEILDLAVRASGNLIVAIRRQNTQNNAELGYILEIDHTGQNLSLFADLGTWLPVRLGIDRDEAVIAILHNNGDAENNEILVRFGLDATTASPSWSTTEFESQRSQFAIDANGDIYWTGGMLKISRLGEAKSLYPITQTYDVFGSPVLGQDVVVLLLPHVGTSSTPSMTDSYSAIARPTNNSDLLFSRSFSGRTDGMSPAIDGLGNIWWFDRDGHVHVLSDIGEDIFHANIAALTGMSTPLQNIALSFTPKAVMIAVFNEHVIAIQSAASIAATPWPRNRRDNLGTNHQ